ncbi:MAG TPA: glycoside-pentoside-hexuronide (GPH):cation symporter [Rectinemataceae bacterium]|nr:glycoside-pentoside-hexuronide (GPH):cation symporter [Rectinemataceae bacterium]
MAEQKLSLRTKLGYGVCDLGGNLFFTVGSFIVMKYLTDVVGLNPWLAGLSLSVGRVLDAFSDPIVGSLSDRTRTRFGRRRPYMFVGAILLFATMAFFFHNPRLEDQNALFVWAAVGYTLLAAVAYTLVNIPYSSLTPELTQDYNERTSLNGYRFTFAIVGTLLGAGAALPLISAVSGAVIVDNKWVGDPSRGYEIMGIVFGAAMAITALITVFSVKENGARVERPKAGFKNIVAGYLSTFTNKPFLLILIPWTLNIAGVTILSTVLQYYFTNVLNQPDKVTLAMLILLVVAIAFIPIWTAISKRIGKKWSFVAGMLELALCIMLIFIAGPAASIGTLYALIAFCGIGFSTGYALPWSIIPDAIDYDFLKTGENREGVYYGIWTFCSKLGQALSALIIGALLSLTKYDGTIALQNSGTQLVIRFLFGPIAAIFYIAAAIVLIFYPITAEKHTEIRRQIAEREAAKASPNA